jgi:hypothetical protein
MFRQVVPEHVHLAPGSGGGELASGYHSNSKPLTRSNSLGNATHRIVIGESNGSETGSKGTLYYRFRRQTSIRSRRMNVQVDGCAPAHIFGHMAQRRYPISGAVQDGWE